MKALNEKEVAHRNRVKKALAASSRACNDLAKNPMTSDESRIFADYQKNLIKALAAFIANQNKMDTGVLPFFPLQTMREILRENKITQIGHFLDSSLDDLRQLFKSHSMTFPEHIAHLHPSAQKESSSV